ncbi:MAG: hypothetical protein HEP71_27885 [Roseivirga sp.]|nr:hypothetical protein [Roseivirga sp.]
MLAVIMLTLTGCGGENELTSDVIVYDNNFEESDLSNINGGKIVRKFGTNIIGNYNNSGFSLHLNDLPRHNYLYISFTLFIHDTWDGNSNGLDPDAPDKWIMAVNSGLSASSLDSYTGFETTFSNGPCDSALCLLQSYPQEHPSANQPRTGATRLRRGFCSGRVRGTSEYHIERTFSHEDAAVFFSFYDELFQSNVSDQKCDESWSMDNIVVRAITIN